MIYVLYAMIATVIFALSFLIVNRKTIGEAFVVTKTVRIKDNDPKYIDIQHAIEITDDYLHRHYMFAEDIKQNIKREGFEIMHRMIDPHIKVLETNDMIYRKHSMKFYLKIISNQQAPIKTDREHEIPYSYEKDEFIYPMGKLPRK